SKPAKGFAALMAMALMGLTVGLIVSGGPAGAALSAISADGFGNQRTVTILNAVPLPPGLLSFGPTPAATGPGQSVHSASTSGLAYTTGPLDVVTTGSTGPTGSVTTT